MLVQQKNRVNTSGYMNLFTRDTEAKLLEMANNLKGDSTNHYGLHFGFSRLQDHYKSEYQMKIVLNILSDIFKDSEGSIFFCRDLDIFIIYKGEDRILLEKAIFQLRYLFVDDPLAYNADGDENPEFCGVYDLGFQWRVFYQICKEKVGIRSKKEEEGQDTFSGSAAQPMRPQFTAGNTDVGPKILTPGKLAIIENELIRADLRLALRRQPICAMVRGMEFRPVYDEIYINIQHLKRLIGTDIDIASEKWLFKYLTKILDGFVLDTLAKRAAIYLTSPISLNLNVETLLSDKFLRFNSKIDQGFKSSIIIEINVADVFVDMAAFMAAKDLAHELGYRVCLDGLSALTFTQIDRASLGFDLAKLQWNMDMRSDLATDQNASLRDAVTRCGSNRIILCRCDSRNAIDYGQALGISLFQGRYTDSVLNPDAKIIN